MVPKSKQVAVHQMLSRWPEGEGHQQASQVSDKLAKPEGDKLVLPEGEGQTFMHKQRCISLISSCLPLADAG